MMIIMGVIGLVILAIIVCKYKFIIKEKRTKKKRKKETKSNESQIFAFNGLYAFYSNLLKIFKNYLLFHCSQLHVDSLKNSSTLNPFCKSLNKSKPAKTGSKS